MKKSSRKGNNDKIKFRRSEEWRSFRLEMIKSKDYTCECCGKKMLTRYLQVHHKKPDEYENLDPNNFAVLCHKDHEIVERLSKMKHETLADMNQDYIEIFRKFLTNGY